MKILTNIEIKIKTNEAKSGVLINIKKNNIYLINMVNNI